MGGANKHRPSLSPHYIHSMNIVIITSIILERLLRNWSVSMLQGHDKCCFYFVKH